ncbi:3-phosphoinositide dependent protein kinase-1 [Desmophyllum pertusum]|uniref:non-specific serine/threonine protein kinase n=1 Tax=Desmophyllum pertusum TaxID=174260 RepID=A0A9W9ZIB8_9CNID|nr:3-phosphoinositide dependent protein kinase-1 [Desmophyllum pertusum]
MAENGEKKESPTSPTPQAVKKKRPEDFKFGKVLGEGSFSTVYVVRELSTGKEYAMKVLEKRHMIREKKVQYVSREKEVLSKLNHPFFVRLYFTFQDKEKLYFGLSYAKKGELLPYIVKLGSFDLKCTRFYSAEVVSALDHLHGLGIIHRDLKPENILLDADMHIKITDFGTAKLFIGNEANEKGRNSFVGTAQYVSPELLTDKRANKSSDLWALGCIIYQLLSGLPPFRAGNEYQIFKKIISLEYEFPSGFHEVPKGLVQSLLVLDPTKRIGCDQCGGFSSLKSHEFYEGIEWESLPNQTPPDLLPYLPSTTTDQEGLHSKYKLSLHDSDSEEFDDQLLARFGLSDEAPLESSETGNILDLTESERDERLAKQEKESLWHQFVGNNLILKTGVVDKRKGLFPAKEH